jgi:hypothetical protein
MGLQAAVHLGHVSWALTKEEEEEHLYKTTVYMHLQVTQVCQNS